MEALGRAEGRRLVTVPASRSEAEADPEFLGSISPF